MRPLCLAAAVLLCLAPLSVSLPPPTNLAGLVEELATQTGVPNLVSGVILHVRLFDTIGEVVVFTLASLGVRWLLGSERAVRDIRALSDDPSVVLCQWGATIATLVAVELALRGHLSPGGGFAAGVAGGTAIGLVLISGGAAEAESIHRRWRADLWEKGSVLAFLLLSLLALWGLAPPPGRFGTLLSGSWIPVLNVLVAIKVTLGSWSMVQRLVRARGLL
ncbi:cation:proton antiporter [Synechococcus sp. RSCCF101]|nr:cation:proton antiporter [Synechococcus sp. RSCCF101]